MKAVVKFQEGPGNLACREVPEPAPAPGQVKIRVEACGICGSDLKFYHWSMRPGMRIPVPVIFGHEFSGTVAEVGAGVTKWKVGDRVTSETPSYICGQCEMCMTGHSILCATKRSIGYQTDGAMAEYICMRQEIIHPIPDGVATEEAALCEPSCVSLRAVMDIGRVSAGDTVLVLGPGALGLLVTQLAKASGARVILSGMERDEHRLEIAGKLGADRTVMVDKENLAAQVRELTGGRGADVVFECSGAASALDQGMLCAKKRGVVVEVAIFQTGPQTLHSLNTLVNNEIQLLGSYGQRHLNWDRALDLMARGALKTGPLITHRFPLEQCVQAFEVAERQAGVKVLLKPGL